MNPHSALCEECGKYPQGWEGKLCVICLKKADKTHKEAIEMKLWFHDHLVDETTDLAINNLDGYDGTLEEYNGMRKLIGHIRKMRADQSEDEE